MEQNFQTRRCCTSIAVHSIMARQTNHHLARQLWVIWIWTKALMKRYTILKEKIKVNQSDKSLHLRNRRRIKNKQKKNLSYAVSGGVWTVNYTITTNDPTTSPVPSTRSPSVHNQSTAVVMTTDWPIEGSTYHKSRKKDSHANQRSGSIIETRLK